MNIFQLRIDPSSMANSQTIWTSTSNPIFRERPLCIASTMKFCSSPTAKIRVGSTMKSSHSAGHGFTQATTNFFPIIATPLLGAAFVAGGGEAAWLAVAAFVLVGGILNARPVVPPETAENPSS